MKEFIGKSGLIPGIGILKTGDKIDESILTKKQRDALKPYLKDVRKVKEGDNK